jgi:Tol biopolymer transport system component
VTRYVFALLLLLSAAGSADAQYFGRNKVQYNSPDLQVLQTPHFDIYYDSSEQAAVQIAARMAERWYDRLSRTFDHRFARRQPIVLYGSHSRFTQTSILPGFISDGVGGFTDHFAGRVVLPFAAGLRETDHVLGHELVHAFQRDMLRAQGRSLATLPLWFSEGMAEYFSVGRLDANTLMWLRDAVASGHLPTLAQLDDPRWFPYRYGQAWWQFVASKYGEAAVVKALQVKVAGGVMGRLRAATGKDAAALSAEWHEHIRQVSAAAAQESSDDPSMHRVVSAGQDGGRMNVAPRLSPDGRYLVFLSERDRLSVDIFLADASTGTVIRKLVSTAVDAHSDSLEFIDSAGAWDPTGKLFTYASVRDGHAVLTIVEIPSGNVRQELVVRGVDQVFSPAWSPDGRRLAFSGMRGGVTDLFTIDISSGDAKALTSDMYSDLQPSWSPDGTMIVFSSDRFSSAPDALLFGDYQLVTLDLGSGVMRLVAASDSAKAIDPQWASADTVYFVSDSGSISNVYRLAISSGRVEQVTHVTTGVSGITALSPAIAISSNGSRLAMSVYSGGNYEVWTRQLETSPVAAVVPEAPLLSRVTVPPFGIVPSDASAGELPSRAFRSKAYVPRLSLAQFGTPYLSAGGGAFGSFLRGGMSVGFTDLMGQQDLAASVQVGKASTDNAVVVSYANRRSRWNWGLTGGRIPALVGASDTLDSSTSSTGAPLLVRHTSTSQQVHREAGAFVSYPFSRAQRIEANVNVDSVGFENRMTTTPFDGETRVRLGDPVVTNTDGGSATLVQAGGALVYDTTVFGAASPILGQRYRFAVSHSTGDLHVLTASADYRKYLKPFGPFTLAMRGMSAARVGRDAGDERLLPLIWDVRQVVRGYTTTTDMVRTTRFAVGNVELRLPLFSNGRSDRALPIELFGFGDCGRFWMPTAESLEHSSACSAGAGARLNAAGFIFEFNLARPLAGGVPSGWRFGVNFQPGF